MSAPGTQDTSPLVGVEPTRIDMTPTWGAIGLLYLRVALSGETKALRHGAPDIARAFAMAEALSDLFPDLTDAQRERARKVMERETAVAARAYS